MLNILIFFFDTGHLQKKTQFSDSVLYYLRFVLNHSFVNKNKHTKLNIASEFEKVFPQVSKEILKDETEDFNHFLGVYTNPFNQNIHSTQDLT